MITKNVVGYGPVNFPDGTPDSVIKDAIEKRFGHPDQKQSIPQEQQPSFSDLARQAYQRGQYQPGTDPTALKQGIANLAYGAYKGGTDVLNIPHQLLSNRIPKVPDALDQKLQDIMGIKQNDPSFINQALRGAAEFGVQGPIGRGLGILGKAKEGASLLSKLLQTAGHGAYQGAVLGANAAQDQDTGSNLYNAALGAGIGAGSNLAGKAIGSAASEAFSGFPQTRSLYGSAKNKFLASNMEPVLSKSIANDVGDTSNILTDNDNAFLSARRQLRNVWNPEEERIWNRPILKSKDSNTFNPNGYKDRLQSRLDDLKELASKHSGHAEEYKDSISMLEKLIDDSKGINSFKDVVDHSKSLNDWFGKSLTPGKVVRKQDVSFAKKALEDSIDDQLVNPQTNEFRNALHDANAFSTKKHNIFTNGFGNTENPFHKVNKELGNKEEQSAIDSLKRTHAHGNSISTLIDQARGPNELHVLSEMLGDEQQAKDLIRRNKMASAFRLNDPYGRQLVQNFSSMPKESQEYLFNPSEREKFHALNKVEQVKGALSDIHLPAKFSKFSHYVATPIAKSALKNPETQKNIIEFLLKEQQKKAPVKNYISEAIKNHLARPGAYGLVSAALQGNPDEHD